MTRKDSIMKMRDLLVTRRNALRKALAGDLSLLKQLREQSGGDVVDAALDAAQDEISSQLAEVESRELANIERALASIKNGKGDEKALADSQRDIDRINMRLQKLVEKRKMMFEMMSTLSMKFNEMAKTALSNMRSA